MVLMETMGAEVLLDNAQTEVEHFVRQLLGSLEEQPNASKLVWNGDETQSIILDIDIDGVRYTLIRTLRSPHSQSILSPREREIARLIAKGLPNKAIAAILEISPWTVATHLRRIFIKLEVSSRAEMIARMRNVDLLSDYRDDGVMA